MLRHDEDRIAQGQRRSLLIGIDAHGWPLSRTALVSIAGQPLSAYERGSDQLRTRRFTQSE